MKWLDSIRAMVNAALRSARAESELEEELRAHIERRAEDLERSGLTRAEAVRRARIEFGGGEKYKEECREAMGTRFFDALIQDVRFGLRMLRRSPGFAAVAIATLGLGIGANTAMFSVVQGILLAPLPYFMPERLVMLLESNQRFQQDAISYPNFIDWQRNARSFQQIAAIMLHQGVNLSGPGTPEHLDGGEVTAGFFGTLGVTPALGREFTPQEDRRGGAPVVIVSNRLWKSRFGGSPEALDKALSLGGTDYTIVGILPARFRFIGEADVYLPLGQYDPLLLEARGSHAGILGVARLNSGVSVAEAQLEMSAIQARLDQLYPDANRGTGADVEPLKAILVQDVRGTLLLLLGAVGLVLLITCANVANLWMARSAARSGELAIRVALGANRARVVRQLLTESLILSLAGGAMGVLLAIVGTKPLLVAIPRTLPRTAGVAVNVPVLAFTFGVSIVVGILFGLAPALKNSRVLVPVSLKESGRGTTHGRHRAQSGLLIVQMALTLVLLLGAGLLLRTIRHLWSTDPGFNTQHLITFKVGLSPAVGRTSASIRTSYLQLLDRLRAVPGVQAADFTELVPLTDNDNDAPFWINSGKPAEVQNAPRTLVFATGVDYLRTMGIPLLRGRFFTPEDTTKTPFVTVIDSVFAEQYFPGKDPVGQSITFGWDTPVGPCEIVGVVGHVSHWGIGETGNLTRAQSYFSLKQDPDKWVPLNYPDTTILVRTSLDVAAAMPSIKAAVYATGSGQPIYNIRTMQQIVFESMSSQRFPLILLGAFAALALLLASVGVYGVISYTVTQRVHEIGIRMALGAAKQDILRSVIGHGLWLACAGLALGAAAGFVLTRAITSFSRLLFGVRSNDPLTFLAVSLVLATVAALASYIPARRAARVDPLVALRHE